MVETVLDNRDLSTTRIWQEVEVWELIDNVLENSGFPEGIGEALLKYFSDRVEVAHGTADDYDAGDAKYIANMSLEVRLYNLGVYLTHTYKESN